MYNSKAVCIGIAVFVALFTAPFWGGRLGGNYTKTDIVLPTNETACIEDLNFMRSQHMRLLNEWRDAALRSETRVYTAKKDGRKWAISLQNTCLACHKNYQDFCEKCHIPNSVDPYCWTCHIIPKEGKQ